MTWNPYTEINHGDMSPQEILERMQPTHSETDMTNAIDHCEQIAQDLKAERERADKLVQQIVAMQRERSDKAERNLKRIEDYRELGLLEVRMRHLQEDLDRANAELESARRQIRIARRALGWDER